MSANNNSNNSAMDELEIAKKHHDMSKKWLAEKKISLSEAKVVVERLKRAVAEAEAEYKNAQSFLQRAQGKARGMGTTAAAGNTTSSRAHSSNGDSSSNVQHQRRRHRTDDTANTSSTYGTPPQPPPRQRRRMQYSSDEEEGNRSPAAAVQVTPNHREAAAVAGMSSNDSSDEEDDPEDDPDWGTTRVARASSAVARAASTSTVARAALQHDHDTNWMEDMEIFLLTVPHGKSKKTINDDNTKKVMLTVSQLVSGEGIRYHRWPKNKIFAKNEPISLMSTDFDELLGRAKAWESKYGKDLGNGWLMRHGIGKLKEYQEYCCRQRGVRYV